MRSGLVKKILFSLIVLGVISLEFFIVYAIHFRSYEFLGLWESFGIEQTQWSRFVFDTARFWWWLPKMSVVLWVYTLKNFQIKTVLLTLIFNLLIIFSLLWAIYEPTMIIDLSK
ncbi:hypothetical protein [Acinetobacter haemolyticus]|uniref:hypothetical protein n=1 Tax=Acinetobacter haemolyticus TaxID=29430 RepID=UPI001372ECC8|nr:hypothetical protein [Acinetobacter haemolyticus]NAR98885.1 hypothetical protein [Acinetobacter haemolyticus]